MNREKAKEVADLISTLADCGVEKASDVADAQKRFIRIYLLAEELSDYFAECDFFSADEDQA